MAIGATTTCLKSTNAFIALRMPRITFVAAVNDYSAHEGERSDPYLVEAGGNELIPIGKAQNLKCFSLTPKLAAYFFCLSRFRFIVKNSQYRKWLLNNGSGKTHSSCVSVTN